MLPSNMICIYIYSARLLWWISYPIWYNIQSIIYHLLLNPIYLMANAIVSVIQIRRCMGRPYHWINRRLFKTLPYMSYIISSTLQWCPVSVTVSQVAYNLSLCSAACSSGFQWTHRSPTLLAVCHGKLSATSGFAWLRAGNAESISMT